MSDIVKIVGERIRAYRNKLGLSQETLAEKAELHSTYIGQLERGEKNATLESIEKVCKALNVPPEVLLKNIIVTEGYKSNEVSNEIYNIVSSLKHYEQVCILKIIKEIIYFKKF